MSTLLFFGLTLALQFIVNTLLLWGLARLLKLERATVLRAFLAVILQSVAGTALFAVAKYVEMPQGMSTTIAVWGAEVALLFLVWWWIVWLVFVASAGRSALVSACQLGLASALGVGVYFGLTQVVSAYVVSTNSMAPTLLGHHFAATCPRCQGNAVISAPPPGEDAFRPPPDEPANAICLQCQKISELKPGGRGVHGPDRFVANHLLTPARWDVIVFRYPRDPSVRYVKRLVGLPGETVTIREKAVWINDVRLEPPPEIAGLEYIPDVLIQGLPGQPPAPEESRQCVLGPAEYFVLGDFTTNAADSRFWGTVPAENIESVATLVYWPPARWRILR